MKKLAAVEFECPDTGYRFWKVCKQEHVDACIDKYNALGYETSDVDEASDTYSGPIFDPTWGFYE